MSYPSYSDLELKIQELEQENGTLKANVEFLHSCLDDRENSIELMRKELNNLEDVKTVLGDIVMNLTKLDKLKKIVFKDDAELKD